MDRPPVEDLIDWHGCDAVEFDPQKLGGHANLSEHLKPLLTRHAVTAARDRCWDGWDVLRNGDPLRAAEAEMFGVLLTADKKIF